MLVAPLLSPSDTALCQILPLLPSAVQLSREWFLAIGPIFGGVLANYPGWRWIFWLLALLSGTCLVLLALLLPETARSIVGNGTIDATGFRRPIYSYLQSLKIIPSEKKVNSPANGLAVPNENPTPKQLRIPNPLESLKLLWAKDTALITLIFGIFYMNLSSLQASTSTLFINLYGISDLQAGLIYLPSGIGSCIGAYGAGPVLERDYRRTARKHNITIDVRGGDNMANFPIEKARFRSIWYVITAASVSMIGYGWALYFKVNMVVPLVLQFIIGFSTAAIFNMCGALLVDVHPSSPSTAQAANSIVRASLAGGGTAVVQILIDAMGVGWTFTLYGGICMACLGIAWLEWAYGKSWRDKMRERGVER